MRRIASKFVTYILFALSIGAASNPARATDYGDLWWNPAESGWGMQTAHQANSMFITFYVFGSDSKPTWFTALTTSTPGGSTFAGTLVATTGPYYGGPFAPPAVNRTAGTVTFIATSPTTANVTYTVDGVTVTKAIQRLALATLNLSGTYVGSFLSLKQLFQSRLQWPFQRFRPVHDHAQSAVTAGHDRRHADRQHRQLHVHLPGHVRSARTDRQHPGDVFVHQRADGHVERERDRAFDARRHSGALHRHQRSAGVPDHGRLRRSQALA